MELDWGDLAAAFALYLVIEGLMPFLSPATMKRAMAAFLQMPESQLRGAGIASILAGLALLWFVRH